MAFHPYLFFGGDCRQAFTRYQEIFGGELVLLPMSEAPDQEAPPERADLIMHAALTVGDALLMASDDPTDDFAPGRSAYVNVTLDDVGETERIFTDLADGGSIVMPLEETFWSPRFGMCVDQFGTPWMVSAETPPEA